MLERADGGWQNNMQLQPILERVSNGSNLCYSLDKVLRQLSEKHGKKTFKRPAQNDMPTKY